MIHSQLRASLYNSGQPGERMIPLGAFRSPPHGAKRKHTKEKNQKKVSTITKIMTVL